jgi:FkbM family methyltransferase
MKTPAIERSLRFRASGVVKSLVYGLYGIPFSRYGLEPGLVPFLPQGKPISLIDVGAASGEFTAAILDHCGIERALLVEPQPDRARELAERFADPRVVVRQCAVSDRAGQMPFEILESSYSSSILPVLPEAGGAGDRLNLSVRERVTIDVETLDALVDAFSPGTAVDLLKIDTQGAELLVLRGAARTLPRVRMIWTEVSFVELYQGAALFADLQAFLRAQGFRLYSIHEGFRGPDGELLQADALFLSSSIATAVP